MSRGFAHLEKKKEYNCFLDLFRLGSHHGLLGLTGLVLDALFALALSTISTGSNFVVESILLIIRK